MAKLQYGAGTSLTERTLTPPSRELQALLTGTVRKLNAGADVVAVTSPDASDLPTAITLVNELKAQLDLIIAAMKA